MENQKKPPVKRHEALAVVYAADLTPDQREILARYIDQLSDEEMRRAFNPKKLRIVDEVRYDLARRLLAGRPDLSMDRILVEVNEAVEEMKSEGIISDNV